MDGGDVGVILLLGLAWAAFNKWNDTRIRYRCGARDGWGWCRTPVHGPDVRCSEHISRRARSLGP